MPEEPCQLKPSELPDRKVATQLLCQPKDFDKKVQGIKTPKTIDIFQNSKNNNAKPNKFSGQKQPPCSPDPKKC